jgi:hypothetical protein
VIPDLTLIGRSGSTFMGLKPSDFTHQTSPLSTHKVLIDDGAIKYSTLAEVATAIGVPAAFSMAGSAPVNWWRADNVTATAGNVDTIVDNGSLARNFTATTTDRTTLGTDSDGKTYLNFSAHKYAAGAAVADWVWLHDNSLDLTISVVFSKTSWPAAGNNPLCLLSTLTDRSNGLGMVMCAGRNKSGNMGGGATGNYWGWETRWTDCLFTASGRLGPAPTTKQIFTFRVGHARADVQYGGSGAQNAPSGVGGFFADHWSQGERLTQLNASTGAVQTANPAQLLTLGAFSDRTFPFVGRVYEVVIWQRRLTDAELLAHAKDAASRYVFTL